MSDDGVRNSNSKIVANLVNLAIANRVDLIHINLGRRVLRDKK